jgi:hypothetical protein
MHQSFARRIEIYIECAFYSYRRMFPLRLQHKMEMLGAILCRDLDQNLKCGKEGRWIL